MNDEELLNRVEDVLRHETSLDARAVKVKVFDGIVYLEGSVRDSFERSTAEDLSRRIAGVQDVHNYIKVPPAGPGNDQRLQRRAHDTIRDLFANGSADVRVMVAEGWIDLTGWVSTTGQRSAAEAALRDIEGVKGVTNRILVGPIPGPRLPTKAHVPEPHRLN